MPFAKIFEVGLWTPLLPQTPLQLKAYPYENDNHFFLAYNELVTG